MFKVVEIEFDETGTETRRLMFSDRNINRCWDFVISRQLHPSKQVRLKSNNLFVFDSLNNLCTRVPKRVKDTVLT